MRGLILGGILLLAFLLRVVGISSYPVGFTPDEASFGYDAYSLLKTGKDQWGQSWPLMFRSFGDFKLPFYAYLSIPSVAAFGLNEFAVRLTNALFGTLAVLATYLMVAKLGVGSTQYAIRNTALFAAFLLAISPWHVSLSRGAFEANLTSFFMPLGVWAFLKGLANPRFMILAAFSFGLNLFTYHSARILAPILVGILVCWNRKDLSWSRYRIAAVVFLAFLVLAAYTMLAGASARGTDVVIFNPTDKWSAVADRRYGAVLSGVPDQIARVFSNKLVYSFDLFVGNYLSYFSPQFLFTHGAAEWTYGMIPGRGVLHLIELPFLFAAVWVLIRGQTNRGLKFVIVWLLLAPIPTALTKGPGHAANRVAVMMPAIQVLSAYGAVILWNLARTKWPRLKHKLLYGYIAILLFSLAFFLEDYRYHAPRDGAGPMLYGRREAIEFVQSIEASYDEIIVSRSLSEPQVYVAFYQRWDPSDYQKEARDWLRYEKEGLSFVDQLGEYKLGKYTFRNIEYSRGKNKKGVLLVGKPEEFPSDITLLYRVRYPNGKDAIWIVNAK